MKPLTDQILSQHCAQCKNKYFFSCKECKFGSKSIIQMSSHVKELHHSKFKNIKEFEYLKSLDQEFWQEKQDMYDGKIQPITRCKKCGHPYRCLSRLKRHEKLCTTTPMLQCTLCPEFVNFEQELREHLVVKHGKQEDGKELSIMIREIKKKIKKKNMKVRQTILANENSNVLNMNFAQMHINDMAEISCTKCKVLVKKVNAKDLKCSKCRQSYTYTCLGCKTRFQKIGSLRMHYNRKHGPKLFSCQHCNRKFAYLSDLNCHMKLCNESSVYQCKYCITKTKHMTEMRYHLVHEHGVRFGFARSWICHTCGKKYARKQGLILHQRNYCGKKPNFRCSLCAYYSYTKHHLTNHIKMKHGDENNRKKRKINPVKRR
ncbi:hypothetical protein TKK_0011026 [Trichogramma kaykai]|uniref:C2H2-type domain-containing protein n=1 Tax=Trichogramma kaykai TaxID=54128 RepID=A0ABD2WVU0_9HYME